MAKTEPRARRVGRGAKDDLRPNRIKLLVSVLNHGDDEKLNEILNDFSVSVAFSCIGTGTARGAVLNYLGIGTSEKSVMFSLIPESDEDAILDSIRDEMSLYLVGKGISFTVPLTGVSELVSGITAAAQSKTVDGRKIMKDKDRKYDLIVAVVAAGYVDDAMDAARQAGAAGGTIIRSRAVSNAKAEQFIGISLHEDADMLMILTPRSNKAAIMDALNAAVGLKEEARGVIYSLPVDKTAGIGIVNHTEQKAEQKAEQSSVERNTDAQATE